jgi:hypothetical protein
MGCRTSSFTFLQRVQEGYPYSKKRGMGIRKLQEKLEQAKDPKRPWENIRHKRENILVIGLAALICGGEDF